jgi:hypothetical protein
VSCVLFSLIFNRTSVSGASQVTVKNFISVMERVMRPYVSSAMKVHTCLRKRVAVLISGSGTNLQVYFSGCSYFWQWQNSAGVFC